MKKTLTLAAFLASAAAVHAGFTINGVKPNGFVINGVKPNGFNFNGFVLNGVKPNGFNFNGFVLNGVKPNGFNFNGVELNSPAQPGTEPGLHITGIVLADDSE